MPPPVVSAATGRIYAELAGFRRKADAAQTPGWPLLRYAAVLGDGPFAAVDVLLDRFSYVAEDEGPGRRTADLVDPATADVAWLPWLAQFVGARIDRTADEATQRTQVATLNGHYPGTVDAIAAAARTALTGTRNVVVVPHFGGDPWTIGVRTIITETPDDDAVLAAVAAADQIPFGYQLAIDHYESSWDVQEAGYPDWDTRESAPTWDRIESLGG